MAVLGTYTTTVNPWSLQPLIVDDGPSHYTPDANGWYYLTLWDAGNRTTSMSSSTASFTADNGKELVISFEVNDGDLVTFEGYTRSGNYFAGLVQKTGSGTPFLGYTSSISYYLNDTGAQVDSAPISASSNYAVPIVLGYAQNNGPTEDAADNKYAILLQDADAAIPLSKLMEINGKADGIQTITLTATSPKIFSADQISIDGVTLPDNVEHPQTGGTRELIEYITSLITALLYYVGIAFVILPTLVWWFKFIFIDNGLTFFLLIEMGGAVYCLYKNINKGPIGIFKAAGEFLQLNKSLALFIIELLKGLITITSWSIQALAIGIDIGVKAVTAGLGAIGTLITVLLKLL
jgi:hypothetical protein